MPIVAIGGLTGGGGRILGPLVSKRLHADYVDRLILTKAAEKIGVTVEALQNREESPESQSERFMKILQRIFDTPSLISLSSDPYFGRGSIEFFTEEFEDVTISSSPHQVEDAEFIDVISNVIKEMAESGNVVFVGRGASIILKDLPHVLRVSAIANREDRISRVMDRENFEHEQAELKMDQRDAARTSYFKRFFDIDDPDDPNNYHFSINTSEVDFGHASDIIVNAAITLSKFQAPA